MNIKNWSISKGDFYRGYSLVRVGSSDEASSKTINKMNINGFEFKNSSNIAYGRVFRIGGKITSDTFLLDNFTISDGTILGSDWKS